MEDGSVSLINYVPEFVRGCNVLLIHDSTLSLQCLSKMLEQYSFKVTVTHDISAAASMICNDEYNFKLIMAKANIPGMDTLLEVVLFNKGIPVIWFLNHDDAKWKALERETLCYFIHEPLCSNDLKYVWQHVYHSENYSYKETQNVDSQNKHCDEKSLQHTKTKQSVAMEKEKRRRWSSIEMEEEIWSDRERIWTPKRHYKFLKAIHALGENDARPKQILKYMNEPTMTVRQVASHLQKYKNRLKSRNGRNFNLAPTSTSSRSTNKAHIPLPSEGSTSNLGTKDLPTPALNVNNEEAEFLQDFPTELTNNTGSTNLEFFHPPPADSMDQYFQPGATESDGFLKMLDDDSYWDFNDINLREFDQFNQMSETILDGGDDSFNPSGFNNMF